MEEETNRDENKSPEILNNNSLNDNPQQIIEETEKENLITLLLKMRWIVFALLIYLCINNGICSGCII